MQIVGTKNEIESLYSTDQTIFKCCVCLSFFLLLISSLKISLKRKSNLNLLIVDTQLFLT